MSPVLTHSLLSPLPLAFALGVAARLVRSDLALPKDLYAALSIYLLFAVGLKGGVELSTVRLAAIAVPALATVVLGVVTPVVAYALLRHLGRLGVADSAGIAAHYGSVSAVTFIAAQQFAASAGTPAEGFMPTLLTLLESPGITVALGIGVMQSARVAGATDTPGAARSALGPALRELLTARTMVLLVGGLLVGWLTGEHGWVQVAPFFEGGFKGALTLFLLEMGLLAGSRLSDLRRVGPFLVAFALLVPVLHGALGVALGHWAGLSTGGSTVLGAMAASASYIAAPPAVRTTLPEANPTLYLTAALAITFPFNILAGIPLYHAFARLLAGA